MTTTGSAVAFGNFHEFDQWALGPEGPRPGCGKFCFQVCDRHYEVQIVGPKWLGIRAKRWKYYFDYCLCGECLPFSDRLRSDDLP